jgi:RNA recognition motif-containing protein
MSAFQSSMLYSLGLAVAGFFIIKLLGNFGLGHEALFAAGLFIGAVFIATVSNPSQASSTADEQSSGPSKTIYVGNLPYRANEAVIKELFEKYGNVHSVRLLKDRQTGKRRGFGFVEMEEKSAVKAIDALNESEFQQRTLKVREAKDRPEKEHSSEFQAQS